MKRSLAAFVALVVVARPAPAQEPIDGQAAWRITPVYEAWRIGSGTQEEVRSAWQWSVPVVAVATIGRWVTVDGYAAYATGEVERRTLLGTSHARLSGITDVKLRAVVRLASDAVLLTAGVNVPTGKTALSQEELEALRVLGAPPLRFATPAHGSGTSGTLGAIVTRRVGAWSIGVGASAELRGSYAPLDAAQFGFEALDLDPGEAFRASVGADRLVGESAMTLSASATFYTHDELSGPLAGGGPLARARVRLGPAYAAEWRMRVGSRTFRTLDLFVYDRYRTGQEGPSGERTSGTSANELELGAHGELPLGGRHGVVLGVEGRHHTGLSADPSLATSGILAAGGSVGVAVRHGRWTAQPFVRALLGRLSSDGTSPSASAWSAGLTIGSTL